MSSMAIAERARSDDRGAIMVMGIFMSTCLVGALWYIAGIGDAAVYRERLQEGADAVAMSTAVLHARGMNIIVMVNLAMAAVLAIRVALKVLQAAVVIALIIVTICAAIPPPFNPMEPACAAAIAPLESANATLQGWINVTRTPINEALEALNMAAKGLAHVIPFTSIAGGELAGQRYEPFVKFPVLVLPAPGVLTDGLPVTDGTTARLCVEAGHVVIEIIELVSKPIPGMADAASFISPLFDTILSRGANYFCELDANAQPPDLSDVTQGQAAKQCDDDRDALIRKEQKADMDWQQECGKDHVTCQENIFTFNRFEPISQISGPEADRLARSTKDVDIVKRNELERLKGEFDAARKEADYARTHRDECIRNMKAKMKQQADQNNAANKPPGGNNANKTPRKVRQSWKNGVADGQVLAGIKADESRGSLLNFGPKGARIGALQDRRAKDMPSAPLGYDYGYAQAEFFFDCGKAWTDTDCNGPYNPGGKDEEAMWKMRWRARLRRYNAPFQGVSEFLDLYVAAGMITLGTKAFVSASATSIGNMGLRGELLRANPRDYELH